MNQYQLTGAIRQSILVACVGLLAKHGFTAPQAEQIAEALLAIGMYIWSWLEKREDAILAKADAINDKNSPKPTIP